MDYPSVRDYTIEVFGDGAPLDRDDRSFTPGTPASATVKVTDDDKLINVTVSPVKALLTGGDPYFEFRRDGDTSQPLTIEYAYFLHTPGANTDFTYWATATFEAGQDEVVIWHDFGFEEGVEYSPADAENLPLSLTYVVFGDGRLHGLNRIYQGGDPNAATVTMSYNGHDHALTLGAEAPFWVSVGQTVSIPLTVTNAGSLDSGTQITITSTHYSQDRLVNGTNEPRMTCQFDGPIAAGESAGCEVSFLVLEKDLNPTNHAEIELDVVASDGRTTSNAFRIFMRVRNGVSVGFKETANLPVTEPGFGEANARANLTVTRVGQSGEEVQVAYTLEPWPTGFRSYSPVEGVDYADNSATPGVITFGENETEKTITIDILGDQIDEAKEQFLVTLVPPEGVLVEEHKRTRIVVINDTNPPPGESYRPTASLQLVSSGPVPESEGPVEFAIVLDREWGIDGRYEVEVLLDQLTATPGIARLGKKGDFEDPGVLVVRIPAGQTRFEFSIPLYDDDVREEDETFQLLLGSSIDASFRTIGTSNKVLATIADDDDDRVPPTGIELSLSHRGRALASVPEGSNRREITVTASFAQVRWPGDAANAPLHPADPLDVDTTVRVQVDPNSGATHAAGPDDFEPLRMADDLGEFQVVESFDIVIPAGQTSGNATVRFWPVKDDVDEEDETVTLQGSEVVAGNPEDSLPVRPASFTIIDDDTRGITVSPANTLLFLSLEEGGEPGTYSLVLDSQPTDTVVITLAGNQGGFLNLVPDTLTFTTSDWATPQTVSVMAMDDGIAGGVPPTNFITHQVSGGDYGSVTAPDISVNITDTTKAFVYLESGQASESDGYVEFTVTVRPILRTTPVLVRYATVDGTAIAGSDYTREVETGQTYKILNIPAGQSSATIRIPIIDNQVYESADETFTLQLTNHNNKATLDGDATSLTATGAIADDDPKPVVSVAGPAGEVSYVSENAKDPVTFTLTLVGQSAGDVTVDYATGEAGLMDLFTARQGPAGATEGQDYAGASGTVTFTPGQTTKTVTVQVTNDDVSEETEFFGFRISSPRGADLRGQRSEDVADVGLLDDDPRGVAIGPTSIGLDEPVAGGTAVAGAYTMNLNSRPTDTVTVTIGGNDPAVSLSGDTLTNNQLTFTTTNWNTAQTITVTPVKDDNAAGETVTLTHTVSGGDYAGIAADSVTVSLTDSDARNLVLSEESLAVTEGDATGVGYTVKLATQPSDTVTVTISGHDGADLTLSGTTLTNNQLTFTTTNWGTAQTVTVKPGDDDNTDDESETLAHTASGGDYVNITKDLPVSITDDGDPQVTFDPDTVTREVNENTGANQNVGSPVTAAYSGTCTLTYTLGGTDAASFEIDSSTGQLKTRSGVTYDHEAKSTYTVTVTASDANCGADDATVTINVNDVNEPPSVPLEVVAHAVPRSYDQLFARWTPPENAGRPDITGYDIQYGQGSQFFGFSWRDGPQNVDGTSATISGPSPYSHYHVRVRAKNDEGSGPWSEPYFTTTNILDFEVETSLPFIPDGLVPGDRFHLLLVTQPAQALKTKLDDYYSLAGTPVITLPETNPFQRYWKFFYPVASIRHIDARVITNTTYTNEDKGVPVYWVGGGKAADDYEDFYDGDWDDESARNARGEPVALPDGVWTGSTADGRELIDGGTSRALGQSMAGYGAPGSTTTGEGPFYSGSTAANTEMKPIFSLSSVFRIVNPPLATNEGQMSDTDDRRSAMRSQAFTTGSNRHGYELSGVALGKSYRETTRIELSIYSVDANGHPETRLFAFTNPDAYNSHTQAFNAPAGATLGPGATYAIVVQHATSGDDLNLYTTASDNEDDESLDGWSIADAFHYESGRSWQAEADGKALKIIVRGIAKAGPSLAPSGLTATAVGRDRIDLSWTAPTDDGGSAITGYRIESSADGSAGWADLVADTGSAATIYSHTGLMPNTTRHYRVSAINGEGASDPSDTANATTGDNPAVTVSFGQAAYTVLEGGMVTVTVTLNADPERTVVIPITATPQGATTTDDYTVPTSVTFDAGDMSKTITFTATQDNLDDDGESVKLTFGTLPSRVSAGTTATTTVSITDDDTPPTASDGTVTTNEDTSYTFAADEFGYADADGDALAHVKIIELPAAGTGALTLNGTAIPSADLPKTVTATELTGGKLKYAPPANANGTGYASFKFKVNDGTADSAEYTITINVTAVNDPATGTPTISGTAQVGQILTASTGDIADADGLPSAFIYQWKRYAADRITFEADIGTDSMTYTLTESEEGKKVRVEVSFTDNGGSSEGPLVSALYPSTQSQTVDPNNPPTASDGTVTTVEDTDHTFAAANFSYSDTDSDPMASVKIIELPAAGTGALTLNGTAITSADLPKTVTATELTGGGLKYAPPANANGTGYASFKFKVNDGTADSASEYFMTINVTAVNDPATGTPTISGTAQVGQILTASTGDIADPDGVPSAFTYQWKRYAADRITFEANIGTDSMTYTLTASEEGKKVLVEVSFTDNGGSSEGPLVSALYPSTQSQTVDPNNPPTASDGTVTTVEDTDHTFAAANFSYSDTDSDPMASVKIIELPAAGTGALTLNGTAIPSADLPKTVTAAEVTVGKLKYAPPANANGTGYASFKFKVNDGTEDSASEYFMTINVTAVNDPATGAPTISGTAHVGLTLTASTAGIDDVDGLPSAFTYQWKRVDADGTSNPTDIGADSSTYTLTAAEEGKKVLVEVSFTDNGGSSEGPLVSALYPSSGTVQRITVSFAQAAYTVAEGAEQLVTVHLSADPERTVAIPITATPQDSASSADYSVPTSVTFNAGDMSKTITFTATQDAEDDDGESVLLAFGILPDGVSPGTRNETTVSITDDDVPQVTVSFGQAAYTVAEGGTQSVTVTLSADPERTVVIPITHTPQDGADSPADYTVPPSVTFNTGQMSQTITFEAIQDEVDDDGESVLLAFGILPGGVSLGTTVTTTVSITDDDVPPVTVQFGDTTYEVVEGETVTVAVTLSADPERTVVIPLTHTPQGNTTSTDYSGVPANVTFSTGDMSQTITFTATQDDVDDDGESVLLGFGMTLPPAVSLGTTTQATVSITDDDAAGVTIEPAALSVVAGRSNEYTAALATEPTGEVTVTISGHAGTAVTLDKTTLTFTTDNWDTAQTVTVSATQNAATAKVTLAHTVAGADYGSVTAEPVVVSVVGVAGQQTTLQVGVSSSTQTLTVPEGGANSYTLVLGSRPTGDVAVGVTLPTGTDLTLDKTTLTFTSTNWDVAQTVTVTAAEDDDGVTDAGVTLTHTVSGGGYGSTTVPDVEVSITENDTAGLVLSKTGLTVTEGDAAGSSYTVKLATRPSGSVSVTISGHDGADLSLSGTTLSSNQLTFTVDDWNAAQTVTVKAGHDDDGAADTAALTHTASGGDYAGITADLPVTVTDDDTAAIVLSETGLTVTEGDAAGSSYTVKLATEPSGSVIVTISGHDGADLTLSGTTLTNNQLTFTTTNWATAQTVTVKAGDDDNADNESETLAHTAFGGDYVNVTKDLPVSITDDEVPVTVQFGATTYEVVEGETVTVAVTLSADPERTVVIPITHTPQGNTTSTDYSGVPANVTFSTGDMSQTITFTATQDDVDDGGKSVLLAFGTTLPGGVSLGTTTTTTVNITDDDGAGVTVSDSSLTIAEGSSGTYTIVLDSQPTANVTVTINDPTDNTDATADPASLTFASTDWSTPQTVTVRAAQDADAENDTATVTHTVTSTDSIYSGASASSVTVTITDDEVPVTVSFGQANYTVAEGDPVSVTVTLSADPERMVVIPLTHTPQGSTTSADYSGVPANVTFSTGDMSQTITFTATQDDVDDGGKSVLLAFGTTLPGGVSLGTTTTTTVNITDDDGAGVSVSDSSLTIAEGSSGTYTIVLDSQPTADVTVTINDPSNTDVTAEPAGLTFSSTDWNTPKTVTVDAAQDDDADDETATVTHTVTSTDSKYSGASANSVTVTITDDEVPVTVSFGQANYTVAEGDPVSVTVTLSADPERTVVIPLTHTPQGNTTSTDYSGVPANVTFSTGDMSQTITFTATQDDVDDGGKSVLLAFGTLPPAVSLGTTTQATVSITDDDGAGVSVSESSLTIAEGSSGTYTIVLDSQPTADVTVTINDPSNTDVTAEPAGLTFSSTDWNTPKTVTVNAAQDADADDETATVTHTVTSTDSSYSGASANSVTVTITDDEVPVTVSFGQANYTVAEGDPVSVTVTLSADPERTVVIPLTHTPQGNTTSTDYSGVPANVTFSTGDMSQTITFTATQDDVDDGGKSVLLAFGTLPPAVSLGTTTQATVSITDDDGAGVTVSNNSLDITEGSSGTYTIVLDSQPTADVTVTINDPSNTDVIAEPASLTFSSTDWNSPKTVTVNAAQDADAEDETATVTHAVTSTDSSYSGASANNVAVSVTDDEVPVTVQFGATTYEVVEGETITVAVTLSADPERTVVIPITHTPRSGAESPADYSGVPTSVTFNTGQMSKTIAFTAAQDDVDDDGESVLLAFGAPLPGGVSLGTTVTTTVSITDDDGAGVSVSESSLTIAEGSSGTYTIVLDSQPTADVAVAINDPSNTDVTAEPASLTFSSTDWNTPKTVTVNAAQDADVEDETATVTHAVTSTDSSYSGAPANSVAVSVTDDEVTVTVQFGATTYEVVEGETVTVAVTLSADPERTVVIPITHTPRSGAESPADYSVPQSVTFDAGEMSKTITFTAAQDDVDDDGESVLLAFGAPLPGGVSLGTTVTTTVSITDDDDPQVAVSFDRASYRVLEGDTVTVGVTLSGDPKRTVEIPLTATDYGGASSEDYSGVPSSVTINAGETSKTFEFMAMADDASDTGESVMIGFGTSLPSRVTEGTPIEARVNINQMSTQFSLDCSLTATVWCADLGFSDRVAENYGWLYMRYGHGWDPPSSLSDDDFRFRGVDYDVRSMELLAGTHPVMPNAWSTWQQGYSSFRIGIYWDHRWGAPSEEHYRDWVLHLDGLELPFKDALRHGSDFVWVGAEFQQVFNDWTPSTVTKIGIKEVAAADQDTNPLLPWAPMQVDAWPEGPDRLLIVWAKPASFYPGLPDPTSYTVQWKLASADWSDSAAVSQLEVAATSNFQAVIMNGMTEDAVYSVRVIASNDAGDGPPSEETLGRPQDSLPRLIARTVNRQTLNLRFSEQLDPNAVPAATNFVVKADGGLIMVDSVAISGDEVILTLHHAVTAATHSVLVRYDKPTDPSAVFLQDTNGNYANIRQHHELLEVVNITPQSSVQPLTALFTNMPSSHDGRTRFTFDIEFSEPVWIGDGLARDDMLEITGGTVISAPWKDRRTDKFIVHVRPDTQGDIVIVLPGHRACHGIVGSHGEVPDPVAGAPCAIGSRVLTNEPTVTIPGPSSPAQQVVENTPAEGEPQINGIPEVGQTLSADTTAISDADGLENAVFQYQWLAEDADISGTTGATYTVVSGDVGQAIRVSVAFTDDGGHEETLTSAPTAVVTVAGLQLQSATVDGSTLTLTYSEVLDTGVTLGTTPFAVNVNGSSRLLIAVGVGESHVLLLLSSAVEAGDTATVDYTAPDGPDFVRDIQGRKAASFSGQAVTNDTASAPDETASAPLTASAHNVPSSHKGQDAFTFELRFSEEPKSDFSYTTVQDHAFTVTGGSVTYVRRLDPPSNIRWEITVTPGSGADVTIALNATTDCSAQGAICTEEGGKLSGGLLLVVPGPNAPATPNTPATDAPTISGTARVGETLTADTTGISDGDGLDNATFAYQWLADDAEINGATAATYTLAGDDAGKAVNVRVSFTDDGGNDEELTSAATGAVAPAPPPANTPATGAPTITGAAQVGETLTAGATGIADGDGLDSATFSYQWLADDAEINGATANSYTLTDAEAGKAIKVRVSFTDDAGNDEQLTSAVTGAVAAAPSPPNTPATGLPTITGTAQVGETLTADTTGISDDDGLDNAAFAYQWLADDAEINSATASSYTLVAADAGKAIKVRVSFTDDAGNDEQLTSAVTGAVAAAPSPPNTPATGLPTITGAAQVGETLTADTTGISDDDGLDNAAFAYQWLADDAEIDSAIASSYTLVAADAGKAIKVRVSFTDDAGNDEQLTSAVTAAVVKLPLTASVHDVPSSHNGQDAFTFELRFSGDPKPDFSYTTVRDHAFTVTGGSVTYVRRLEPGKNVRWEITVTPSSSADMTIALNATTDCSAQDAICTEDGRMLSNRLELTINGTDQ